MTSHFDLSPWDTTPRLFALAAPEPYRACWYGADRRWHEGDVRDIGPADLRAMPKSDRRKIDWYLEEVAAS